jgi:hypothetical protein
LVSQIIYLFSVCFIFHVSKMISTIALILSGLAVSAFAQEVDSQEFQIDSMAADVEAAEVEAMSRFGGGFGGGGRFNPSLFRDYPGYSWFPYPHATYPLRTLPNIPFGRHVPPTYFGDSYPRFSRSSYRVPQSFQSIQRQY